MDKKKHRNVLVLYIIKLQYENMPNTAMWITGLILKTNNSHQNVNSNDSNGMLKCLKFQAYAPG